jgi:hypothetical protein
MRASIDVRRSSGPWDERKIQILGRLFVRELGASIIVPIAAHPSKLSLSRARVESASSALRAGSRRFDQRTRYVAFMGK